MKAQLFASAALVLLNAIPGVLSAEVSRPLLFSCGVAIFADVPLTYLDSPSLHLHLSSQPQLRGVILVTDFEDQLDLFDSKGEDLSGDFETEPYEEYDSSEDEEFVMDPSEEEFYSKRRPRGGQNIGGRRGVCAGGSAENCGSLSTGKVRCTWTDSRGCVRMRRGGGVKKQMNKPSIGGEACCFSFRYYYCA